MALSLLFVGTSRYQLVHDDRVVGYLEGDSLVFTGFESLMDAEHAGDAGYVALLEWLAGPEYGRRDEPLEIHVAVGEDHSSEWIGPNGRVLARIIRPDADEHYLIEFRLPPELPVTLMHRAASRIAEAMLAARRAPAAGAPELQVPETELQR